MVLSSLTSSSISVSLLLAAGTLASNIEGVALRVPPHQVVAGKDSVLLHMRRCSNVKMPFLCLESTNLVSASLSSTLMEILTPAA